MHLISSGFFLFRQINDAIDRFRGVEETVGKKRSSRKRANVDEVQGPVQVLLMPIRHGANGLNLVEAQHVMLLEPLLNPAMEAQAINRVHRIGQTRATFVHRFIVSVICINNVSVFNSW